MNALSLSKSTPRRSQGNRFCARLIASTTSEPSRVTNGRHSVQPVAISTMVSVWMNEPATDVPPCATMSTSQKPGGGPVPIVVRAVRDRAAVGRAEAGTAPFAAPRPDLYVAEQAVDGCSPHGENTITVRLAKLQSPVSLKRRQQSRDHP